MDVVAFGQDRLPAVFDEIERGSPRMDFADGCAVVLARSYHQAFVLTTDFRDFSAYGVPFASPEGAFHAPEEPAAAPPEPLSPESRPAESQPGDENEPRAPAGDEPASHAAAAGALETVAGRRRPARYGLLMQLESRAGDPELGRLVDHTIWINDVHPAYLRAVASRSLGYHTALAVALALAPLAVERHDEHAFVTQFLAQWGAAQTPKRAPRRGGGGRKPVSRRR